MSGSQYSVGLTGRTRFRIGKSFGSKGKMILQVEDRKANESYEGGYIDTNYYNTWRDATFEDFQELNIGKIDLSQ